VSITVAWYGLGLQKILEDGIGGNLESVTNKLALVTDAYTPNRDTHDFWDDVSASELASGNGYTTGGVTLANVAVTYDAASDQVRVDCDDPSWTFTASKTWRYGVWYVDTAGASSTDPLIALLTWDSNQTVSTAYTLTIDSAGLLYLDTT
jgi:hypothetical protein